MIIIALISPKIYQEVSKQKTKKSLLLQNRIEWVVNLHVPFEIKIVNGKKERPF